MLLKDAPVHVKAGPDDGLAEGVFEAYASIFGNVDSYGDVVAKGAFATDLKRWEDSGNPIPLLFGHQMADPDFNIGHVLKATEDDRGLKVSAQLDLENPKAVQVYRLLKGRRINQMSFAYDVLDADEVDTADGAKANELRELKLYEVSVVTIGANQETEVLAVKAAQVAGQVAEQTAADVKAGRVLAQKHIDSLRAAQEAIGAVVKAAEAGNTSDTEPEKASGTDEAKSDASDEEPTGNAEAKSSVSDEEPKRSPSARYQSAINFIDL